MGTNPTNGEFIFMCRFTVLRHQSLITRAIICSACWTFWGRSPAYVPIWRWRPTHGKCCPSTSEAGTSLTSWSPNTIGPWLVWRSAVSAQENDGFLKESAVDFVSSRFIGARPGIESDDRLVELPGRMVAWRRWKRGKIALFAGRNDVFVHRWYVSQ